MQNFRERGEEQTPPVNIAVAAEASATKGREGKEEEAGDGIPCPQGQKKAGKKRSVRASAGRRISGKDSGRQTTIRRKNSRRKEKKEKESPSGPDSKGEKEMTTVHENPKGLEKTFPAGESSDAREG